MQPEVLVQQQIIATVEGKPWTELPADLFIPPDALEVLLESFIGPLDLLLYLIRRQNLNILDIPIALITRQYLHYIQLMEDCRLELAADYLVMAALLAEIKSKMLLPPRMHDEELIEEDPRASLVRKLQLYEQFKEAAVQLDGLARNDRDFFRFAVQAAGNEVIKLHPEVSLEMLVDAMQVLVKRQGHQVCHQITREPLSVRERMSLVLERLHKEGSVSLYSLFSRAEGRMGLAVSLLAILELARQSIIVIIQTAAFAGVHIQELSSG